MTADTAWRRIYATNAFGRLVTGAITHRDREQAEAYAERLPDADEWRATFDRRLPAVDGGDPDRPLVLRVAEDGLEIGTPGPEGWNPVRLTAPVEADGTAKFGRMLCYYADDDHSDITPETVADAVHPDDEAAWRTAFEAYLDEE